MIGETRWWFHKQFCFQPELGQNFPFEYIIFFKMVGSNTTSFLKFKTIYTHIGT